jgi:hypothetical protein
MFVATAAVSVSLAALLAFSALRKLSHQEQVVQSYVRVGVPERRLNSLAFILLAGALGLIVGLVWSPLGVAAAIGVVCYFAVAIGFHIRANDVTGLPTPLTYALLAAIALILRVLTR